MSEHYPKNCIEATEWCNPCFKRTQHRIDHGRVGPCLECIARREKEAAERKPKEPEIEQGRLF